MVNFRHFFNNIFPLSFEGSFKHGTHFEVWADMFQTFQNACILAPRKHAKSYTVYAYIMWRMLHNADRNYSIYYVSFNQDLAGRHLKELKQLIKENPFFSECQDLSKAESKLRYTWDGEHVFEVDPIGILAFGRGLHPHEMILDDPLQDPTTILDLTVINKINDRVREAWMSLPKEGGNIRVIGTSQTPNDFFFDWRNNPKWGWRMDIAIVNEATKQVLWPEQFSYDRLAEIKKEIGTKAFMKEYMMNPVYALESFFRPDQISSVIWQADNPNLPNYDSDMTPRAYLETSNNVVASWDPGKKVHPAHFSVFEVVDGKKRQRFQIFFDGMDYSDQVNNVLSYVDRFKIDTCYFDNTRSELESYWEKNILPRSVFKPLVMTDKNQHKMAVAYERDVNDKIIMLLPDERQRQSILQVTNDLEAVESNIGHGDAFWTGAMVCGGDRISSTQMIQDKARIL